MKINNSEYRWYHVSEKLPKAHELVWFLWKDHVDDIVIGSRLYESGDQEPHEGWYELENKVRWTHWWHPIQTVKPPLDRIDEVQAIESPSISPALLQLIDPAPMPEFKSEQIELVQHDCPYCECNEPEIPHMSLVDAIKEISGINEEMLGASRKKD